MTPSIDYRRTYNVIPADASDERAVEIFLHGWRRARQTAGGSYDDAGIGQLDEKTAVLWDIPEDRRDAYRDFFAHHYPGTRVVFPDPDAASPLDLTWFPPLLRPPRPATYRVRLRLQTPPQPEHTDSPTPPARPGIWRSPRSDGRDRIPPPPAQAGSPDPATPPECIAFARWTGSCWVDCLPEHAITAWAYLHQRE